jgi:E3 ubiquitin-protein ligase RGLG
MLNPYQSVISIMGRTLEAFDDDKLIPAYGFGDKTTADRSVFNFNPNGASCQGFEDVLRKYTEIVPRIALAGPTSFAPIIREAIRIVKQTKSYHILVIVADGQVTNTQETVDAIVEASNYPLSILLVGVGDGPWDQMNEFDDNLPQRRFDNFQFVDFHTTMVRNDGSEVVFATQAMMEIPDQFKAIRDLNLFQNCK